jgi:hypothetical protein
MQQIMGEAKEVSLQQSNRFAGTKGTKTETQERHVG